MAGSITLDKSKRTKSVESVPIRGLKSKKCRCRLQSRKNFCPLHATLNVFSDYSQRSTIHGVRYLGEKRRHWTERIWWFISFGISLVVSSQLIYQIYWRFVYAPVMISFADETTPISSIPFPTVTICSDLKVQPIRLNYSSIYNQLSDFDFPDADLTEEEVQQVNSFANFCKPPPFLGEYVKMKNIRIDQNILPYIEELSPDLFSENDVCKLAADQDFDCHTIFTKTLTDAGLCYTFNHLDSKQVFNENKLADDFPTLKPFQILYEHPVGSSINRSFEMRNLSFPYRMRNAGESQALISNC